jgi:hypothetical protein
MIRRVVEHNKLNGVVFSMVEFLVVAAAATFIAVGLGLNDRWLGVVLAVGTALNSLVIVLFAVAALRRGNLGNSVRDLTHANYREELRREHPSMTKDTLTLTGSVLVPYFLLVAVAVELRQRTG